MKYNMDDLLNEQEGLMSNMSDEEREYTKAVAYHEAAHAVVGILLGFNIEGIYVVPLDLGGGGGCQWIDTPQEIKAEDLTEDHAASFEKYILRTAAGLEAEKHLGRDCEGAARQLFAGDDAFICASCPAIAHVRGGDAATIELSLREQSKAMVLANWKDIAALADALCPLLRLDRAGIESAVPGLFHNAAPSK